MKARLPDIYNKSASHLNAKQRRALNEEINKQIIEQDRAHANDIDAMVLYTLHVTFGFGKKRLREFYEALISEHDKLIKHYEMPGEFPWLCKQKLKEIGVDIEDWNSGKF